MYYSLFSLERLVCLYLKKPARGNFVIIREIGFIQLYSKKIIIIFAPLFRATPCDGK